MKKVLEWDKEFKSYEFEKLKEAFNDVLDLLCSEGDDERIAKLKCLSEKVLEYQNAISTESGADFATQESVDLCSEIL